MVNAPMKITATVAAWMASYADPSDLVGRIERGDTVGAVQMMTFYGTPDREEFSTWVRVGEAEVTVTLLPKDEQVRRAVGLLQEQLNQARAAWLTRQQEILDRINKLQAITYEAPEVV